MSKWLMVVVVAVLAVIAAAPARAQPPTETARAEAQAGAQAQPPDQPTAEKPAENAPASSLAPRIAGSLDVSYNYNALQPVNGETLFHAYHVQHDTFLLNAAHLAVTGSGQSLSYAVEVDLGSDAAVDSGDDDVDVQEAWVAYVSPRGLGVKAGKFVTYEGIEVIESGANPTISRGLLFGLAEPFTHVGAVVTYEIDDRFDVAGGVLNGWDVVADNNHGKTFVGKLGYTGDGSLVTASAYAGPEQADNSDDWRFSADVTGMMKLGTIDLWAQVNAGGEQGAAADGEGATWFGAGVQPVFHVSDSFAVGARGEVFRDADGARTGVEQTIVNLTATPAYTVAAGLVVRAELCVDLSSEDVFADDDGDPHGSQALALGEVLYSF
ncbi:MAG TPA: outer membrane beta-barrel protein [Kofleriaceae bacterium]|nr:outer membrane beta-barrel protein [Kofleriaceae bacterium]